VRQGGAVAALYLEVPGSSPCRFRRVSAPPCGCWPGPSRMHARADAWPRS